MIELLHRKRIFFLWLALMLVFAIPAGYFFGKATFYAAFAGAGFYFAWRTFDD